MINQWQGFSTEPCTQRVTDAEVERFIDYIYGVIANGDKLAAEWVMAWLADVFQAPGYKPGTALVLVGFEGAGKSFLGEHFIGPMIGHNHYAQVDSVEAITDKFNSILDNRLFILCDESKATVQGGTGPTIWIELKGINRYEKPSHMRLMFTSNKEHNPLWISSDRNERRFTVLRAANDKIGDRRYWNDMLLYAPAMRSKIMRWLMDYKYDKDMLRRPYDTPIKREIQRVGLDIDVTWVLARISAGFPISENIHTQWYQAFNSIEITDADMRQNTLRRDAWPDRVTMAALEDDYRGFVRAFGKSVFTGSIPTTIRKVMPPGSLNPLGQQTVRSVDTRTGQVISSRIRLYEFPSSEEIITYLRQKYGALIEGVLEEASTLKDLGGPPPEKEREF
jgi:hypothetical protein